MIRIPVPGLMALGIAAAAMLAVLALIPAVFCGGALAQEARNPHDAFFESLMVGGAEKGMVYLEVPLKHTSSFITKMSADGGNGWEEFFGRVLRESPDFSQQAEVPYWGSFAYQNVDWLTVAKSVDLQVNDVVQVRTPTAEGLAKVSRYAIHYNPPGGANLLLAVAEPIGDFKVSDSDFLLAASKLPSCGKHCATRAETPDAQTLMRIRKVIRRGAKIPSGLQIKQVIALQGSFTRPARQYIVYADFGRNSRTNLVGHWRTVILDSDLSTIAVVGENEYTHIQPRAVGDVDGDGLDEIWVGLRGYEGHHSGLIYWRGGTGKEAFGCLANSYNGA